MNRRRPAMRNLVIVDYAECPFEELVQFHTYDLLILLRLVREELSNAYNLMRIIKKASKGVEEEYRRYTARMKVLEGILIDRMGYKPKRVDDKLLASLRAKIENQ